SRVGAQGIQDPHRASGRRRSGSGFPGLPQSAGARADSPVGALGFPRSVAFASGGPTRTGSDSVDHGSIPSAGAGRADRGGTQLVPARLGGVFPLRQLRTDARPDPQLCLDPARAVVVQTGQTPPSSGMGDDPGVEIGEPSGPDQP